MPSKMTGAESSSKHSVDSQDEYEYEYDEDETEIFYVDLDLSSLNGVIKPRPQSRKKLIPNTTKTADSVAAVAASPPPPTLGLAGTESGNATPGTVTGDAQMHAPFAATGRLREAPEPGSEIQVLELESYNPVVSYQNEVYSCTWSDMIGTNMFFSEHEEEIEADPLRATEEYDLLGTSRIKLIGRKAKLTNKPGVEEGYRHAANDVDEEDKDLRHGKGFGSLRSSNPVVNRERKKQAKFLENLMDTKRAKGQSDNVRMVYHAARVPRRELGSAAARAGQASSQEVDELNQRVVRGDAAALKRLQMIYSEPDEQQTDEVVPQAPAPMPGSTWHGSIDTENSNLNQTDNAQNT